MKKEIKIHEGLSEEEKRHLKEAFNKMGYSGYIEPTPKNGCLSIIIVVFILTVATFIV